MVTRRLTKVENNEMFFKPCFSCLLLSLSSSFAAKITKFLRLIRSIHNAKFIPPLFGL